MKTGLRQLFDRWLYGGIWIRILIVLIISQVVFFISAALLFPLIPSGCVAADGDKWDIWWDLYYYFSDPGTQSNALEKEIPRYIALIMSTLGSIFLSGLLISTITNMFERKSDSWKMGFSYYKFKGHTVIIGSDQMVAGLVNQLCEKSENTIVVMTSKDVEQMRITLNATVKNRNYKKRIIVNYGQRDSENYLEKINIAYAKEVYILGDSSEFDDIESFHDSLNVQCVTLIAKLCKQHNVKSLPCHVLFDYKTTYHIFQYANLTPEVDTHIEFHPFNFYDFWARKVLVTGYNKSLDITYKPLDYVPITSADSDRFVHFIVIGMSKMGEALALQAAHIAHFLNYKRRKTKITFIDKNGREEMGTFKQECGELFKVSRSTFIDADAWLEAAEHLPKGERLDESHFITHYGLQPEYAHLVDEDDADKEFIDIEWEFIKGDDHNPIVQERLEQYAKDESAIITVAVCLNLTHISLRSAMHLPKIYYERDIPILVQQRKSPTMVSTLNGTGFSEKQRETLLYRNIRPFGMVYECYDVNISTSIDVCKRLAASYDYFYQHKELPTHIDSEYADRVWRGTIIAKKWSNIFCAASIPTKLRSVGYRWDARSRISSPSFTEEQILALAEVEHNRWNTERLLMGYRPVLQTEDAEIDADKSRKSYYKERFIHYDIRPFNTLKEDETGLKVTVSDEIFIKMLPIIFKS